MNNSKGPKETLCEGLGIVAGDGDLRRDLLAGARSALHSVTQAGGPGPAVAGQTQLLQDFTDQLETVGISLDLQEMELLLASKIGDVVTFLESLDGAVNALWGDTKPPHSRAKLKRKHYSIST